MSSSRSDNLIRDRIIEAARYLQPIRSSVTRVLKALEVPGIPAAQVADLVSMDQVLTAEVLKVANSALLGYGHNCASVHEAVVRLGMKRVKVIALGVGAAETMSGSLKGYRLGGGDLMRHAVSSATIALWLAQALGNVNPEEAYVAGLLHDIGKLLLDQYMLKDQDRIATLIKDSRNPIWMIEEELFGISHADAGGMVAAYWRFPSSLVDAIQCHHRPDKAKRDPVIAALVNMANAFSPNDSSRSDFLEGRFIHESTLELLRVSPEKVEELRHDCSASMKVGV